MHGRPARRRIGAIGTVIALGLLPVAGCGWFGSDSSPEDAVRVFYEAVAGGDTTRAGQGTDDGVSAKNLLDRVREALAPTGLTHRVEQVRRPSSEAGTAEATVALAWNLGKDRTWSYQSTVELRRHRGEWQVHWSPSVVHPKLAVQQTLALRELRPDPAPVLDRDGVPLLSPQKVISVLLDRKAAGDLGAVADGLAGALQQFDSSITRQSILDGAGRVAEGEPYAVISLRETDYQQVKPRIYELPGVRFTTETRLLAPDRAFASQVLPAVRRAVEDQVAGRAGWRVVSLNAAGAEVETLHEQQPELAAAVTTGLSRAVQSAAEDAVETVPQQAMVVAIQPSTGDVLAVAQNSAADRAGALPLSGRYPPGSTFKIVTASAALQAGAVAADAQVPCPGSWVVDGYRIPNNDGFDLGTVPLSVAFARSCNTTFAQLAAGLPADALTRAAQQLGLGVDFELPGVTTVTGSAPPAGDTRERAADGFGQGKVVASPFGMALVAASVVRGSMPTPALLRGVETKADARPDAPPPAVLDAVRAMMRAVVTEGTGSRLASIPDVHGKTGTAEVGDATTSHGWFVGYQGDLAFATLVVDANSSVPALDVTARFLSSVR
ncbi:penicillin-binding transpeptidase domain-containing protein [Streptoalloteichus tenebrarius]|uniref:penicillin-binding transpeptidase domain-containing protein n=1 Tax=Streptoalloteichus tenebrarius (strain ATCC 17920 / DSM 40477 / JCM 4838 / CBS 697.72 / NBRC 16177 / NCIMB 11028 / NRRL B-12390 / A12253. 1 / ISP 5477) TaxID=1933 RepID=UPI0020A3547B|nr:penicillin-binding transpeptidase domain-containing protein [Streptoalloteichus tenebrarius]